MHFIRNILLCRTPVKCDPDGPVRSLVVCTPCVTDPTLPLASPLSRPAPLQPPSPHIATPESQWPTLLSKYVGNSFYINAD